MRGRVITKQLSQERLLVCKTEENGSSDSPIHCFNSTCFRKDKSNGSFRGSNQESVHSNMNESKQTHEDEIPVAKIHVKMTLRAIRSEDVDGNKMINEYVREDVIGIGSYSKVVRYRSKLDGKRYALKIFRRSRLQKLQIGPSQTALNDVLNEVNIMKRLRHRNIVSLFEVIDDPDSDYLYMVLEYVEGNRIFKGCGPPGGIGETNACQYLRDIIEGLIYLHKQNIVHGDIKPENLFLTNEGCIKIGDFGVSHSVMDDNASIRRSPGTPVFSAPECCSGLSYNGKMADIWALGVTLFCMLFGTYPFRGDTLRELYEEIVYKPISIPEDSSPDLIDLLEGLLCKDPNLRLTLEGASHHPWVLKGLDPSL